MEPVRRNFINISDYNYDLPESMIAQYPLPERDSSKLLVWQSRRISSDIFRNISRHIPAGSLLIMNNTKVIRARLLFLKKSGARIEILLIEPVSPSDYESALKATGSAVWKCIAGNMKKWKSMSLSREFSPGYFLTAEKIVAEGDTWLIKFSWNNPSMNFNEVIEATGHVPLPPYIARNDAEIDTERYQTVYSRLPGSVAAPTAGLHFTPDVITDLKFKGIKTAEITLHVGAGTFQPVRVSNVAEHIMHQEHFSVSKSVLDEVRGNLGRIVAVGTTSVRTLESLYWLGTKVIRNSGSLTSVSQWEPYATGDEIPARDALEALSGYLGRNGITRLNALTGIMIIPGYRFRIADALITNFHQPGSTLLLLVSAWTGDSWKSIYDYAAGNGFRFLSYGDSSLLFR